MFMRLLARGWLVGVLLLTAACDSLPLPQITFVTRTPAPPPGPTATPAPGGFVNFRVRVPANTPAEALIVVQLLDEVSGEHITVPLTKSPEAQTWTGNSLATLGRVLRYRYARSSAPVADEVTPTGQPVPYRLLVAEQPNFTAVDTVAAWSDLPFAGDQGAIVGTVRNSNTGQGVLGMIVSAGGQLTLTAGDGGYAFYNVPAGEQRVTVLAPTGALRPTQGTLTVPPSQVMTLNLAAPDPNAVHVSFVVRPPAGTDPTATLRLVGDVAQLGDVFLPGPGGSAVMAARAPTFAPLGDGRFAAQVELYEGTVLHYAYSLGDGYWNSELDGGGARHLREYIVPDHNVILDEAVAAWHTTSPAAPVTFDLSTPLNTPANDLVAIQFYTADWLPPVPMWRSGLNTWRFVLYSPENFTGQIHYRYCRNFACGAADDAATGEGRALNRAFTPTVLPQMIKDSVAAWRWLTPAPPLSVTLPPSAPRGGFVAGLDFPEAWQPTALPLYAETLHNAQALNANTLTVFRRGVARSMAPPILADDLALSLPAAELQTLGEQAHAAGLNLTLHPTTCAYTPYGACEYWNGLNFTPEFWDGWFAAYERYLLTQADVATQAGATTLVVADFKLRPAFPGEPEAAPDADARWRTLIAKVRARFNGQLAFELLMGQTVWPNPPAFLDSVDVIRVFWWAALGSGDAPSADDLAVNAGGLLDTQLYPVQQRFNKPLILSAAYLSALGTATQCLPRPDGPCHPFFDFNPEAPDVGSFAVDLAGQANAYHALLTAVYARGWITGVSTFGYNPAVALQDKSISVRGKSAETLLSAWFLRFLSR